MKTQYAMMRLSMDRKDHATVREIAKKMSTSDIQDRIRRVHEDVHRPLSARDEVDVYRHIKTLKQEFKEEYDDPNLIYEECCSKMNEGEPGSYIFKTSNTLLEIAAKMSGAKQAKDEDSQLKKNQHTSMGCITESGFTKH